MSIMSKSCKSAQGISIMAVLAASTCAQADIILDIGTFDAPETIARGWPGTLNQWGGDKVTIVGSESGIAPRTGSGMLRFDYGGSRASRYSSSDLYQTIDVTSYASEIASGTLTATASYWVNRIAGDSQTDTQFGVGIRAFDGSPTQFPRMVSNNFLDMARNYFQSDADISTWEQLSVSMMIPQNTDFISVWIAPQENVFNDRRGTEFDGHFADDVAVSFSVVPTPGSFAILSVASVACFRRRRRA